MEKQLELDLDEVIMNATEAGKLLGVTSAAVGRWCKQGYFPDAYRVNPRSRSPWRIPKRNVLAFIEERREKQGYFRMPVAG